MHLIEHSTATSRSIASRWHGLAALLCRPSRPRGRDGPHDYPGAHSSPCSSSPSGPRAPSEMRPLRCSTCGCCSRRGRVAPGSTSCCVRRRGAGPGAMICALRPVAMAAVVIGGMLGADVATMATYSLLCNMAVAFVAPVVLSLVGTGPAHAGRHRGRIAPLLGRALRRSAVLPARAAPRGAVGGGAQPHLVLYVAGVARVGHRPHHGLHHRLCATPPRLELAWLWRRWSSASSSSRRGACWPRYGDGATRPAGSRSGEKTRCWPLDGPVVSSTHLVDRPTAYIVWQNFVSSYQIWKHDREAARR